MGDNYTTHHSRIFRVGFLFLIKKRRNWAADAERKRRAHMFHFFNYLVEV